MGLWSLPLLSFTPHRGEGSQLFTHLPGALGSTDVMGARSKWSRKWSFIAKSVREAAKPRLGHPEREVECPRRERAGGQGLGPAALGTSQVHKDRLHLAGRKENRRGDSAAQSTQRPWGAESRPRGSPLRTRSRAGSETLGLLVASPQPVSLTQPGSFPTAQPSLCPQGPLFLGLTSLGIQAGQPTGALTALLGPRALGVSQTAVRGV